MSKKSSRGKSKHRARATKTVEGRHLEQPKPVTPELVAAKSQAPASIARKSQRPVVDYGYVIRDVRYIGILAGSLIVILIILSFILG